MSRLPFKDEEFIRQQIIEAFQNGNFANSYSEELSQYEMEVIEAWGNSLSKEDWIKWTKAGKMPCLPITEAHLDWFDEAVSAMPPVELPPDLHSPFFIFFTGYLKQQYKNGTSQFKIMFKNPREFTIEPLFCAGESKEFKI